MLGREVCVNCRKQGGMPAWRIGKAHSLRFADVLVFERAMNPANQNAAQE